MSPDGLAQFGARPSADAVVNRFVPCKFTGPVVEVFKWHANRLNATWKHYSPVKSTAYTAFDDKIKKSMRRHFYSITSLTFAGVMFSFAEDGPITSGEHGGHCGKGPGEKGIQDLRKSLPVITQQCVWERMSTWPRMSVEKFQTLERQKQANIICYEIERVHSETNTGSNIFNACSNKNNDRRITTTTFFSTIYSITMMKPLVYIRELVHYCFM